MTNLIAFCWPKKWFAFGYTHIIELDGDRLSFLYGGNAMADVTVAVGRTGIGTTGRLNQKVGQVVANKMIAGYTKKLDANVKLYNEGGREELAKHKNSRDFKLSDLSDIIIMAKPAMMDPPAAKLNSNGVIGFTAPDGTRWRMAVRYIPFEEIQAIGEELKHLQTAAVSVS